MYIQEFRPDVMEWAATQIEVLNGRPSFPDSPVGVQTLVRALLRIAHPQLVSLRCNHVPLSDEAITNALATRPEDLDKIEVRPNSRVGPVKPLTWLVDAAVERWVFMPAPVELRQIFIEEVGPAADGEVFGVPARAKVDVAD